MIFINCWHCWDFSQIVQCFPKALLPIPNINLDPDLSTSSPNFQLVFPTLLHTRTLTPTTSTRGGSHGCAGHVCHSVALRYYYRCGTYTAIGWPTMWRSDDLPHGDQILFRQTARGLPQIVNCGKFLKSSFLHSSYKTLDCITLMSTRTT